MIMPIAKFYDYNPAREHQPGDIWSNLPTYGLLDCTHLSGIVITPACDLANNKVETITYLPIIGIDRFLASRIFLPKIEGIIKNLSDNINQDFLTTWGIHKSLEETPNIIKRLHQISNKRNASTITRIIKGIEIYSDILSEHEPHFNKANYQILFGERRFDEIIESIITNSFSTDISFVPQDNQDPAWSIVPVPSIILFRYPLTAPIEIFDLALLTSEENWRTELIKNNGNLPFSTEFSSQRPLKALQIKPAFLHDILIRFTSLYSRLGSPNFSTFALDSIKANIL